MGKKAINIRLLFLILIFLIGCKKQKKIEVPIHYVGYAILQTRDLPDDGGDLFTFYFLPDLKGNYLSKETNLNREISDKSITFIFPQGNEYTEYKIKLNETGWNKTNEDLILVKLNYNLLVPDWKDYTDIRSKRIKINGEEFEIEDYDFLNMANNKGQLLYKINGLEYLEKINHFFTLKLQVKRNSDT